MFIPRKPAKVGVLSFEACCFCPQTSLCYILSISPRVHDYLSTAAALERCLSFIRDYCVGGPLPVVVADSAFSSEAVLDWMQFQGFPFVVSQHTECHSMTYEICGADLVTYSFRAVIDLKG